MVLAGTQHTEPLTETNPRTRRRTHAHGRRTHDTHDTHDVTHTQQTAADSRQQQTSSGTLPSAALLLPAACHFQLLIASFRGTLPYKSTVH